MNWGTSYYPELIPVEEWDSDLDAMLTAGISVLRLFDFAWTALEPSEAVYDWEWADDFLDRLEVRGMQAMICTPTATPPAWLARQYPEIMMVDEKLQSRAWGNRREGDVDHPIFQAFAVEIASQMARRWGRHPAVAGWQIDNELVGSELMRPVNHSRFSQFRFRRWLKREHGNVTTLNGRWGMRFWNQEFSDWGEVETPHHDRPCLGHWLDHQRFFSESIRDFIALQVDAIRPHIGDGVWISHNSTAVFDRGLDHRRLDAPLDRVGFDAYAGAAAGAVRSHRDAFNALACDYFRSDRRAPFVVFETNPFNSPDACPAYYAEMAARGASDLVFWHWRCHRAHVESGGNLFSDFSGRVDEVRMEAFNHVRQRSEWKDLPDAESCAMPAEAAIWFDPDCVRYDRLPNPYRRGEESLNHLRTVGESYGALRRLGVYCDVVNPGEALDGIKLLVLPDAVVLDESDARRLKVFVEDGGTLWALGRCGWRDRWGKYHRDLEAPIGGLQGWTGRWNETEGSVEHALDIGPDGQFKGRGPGPRIVGFDGIVLASVAWGDPWSGALALGTRVVGKGNVIRQPLAGDALCLKGAKVAATIAGIPIYEHPHEQLALLPGRKGLWAFNYGKNAVELRGRTIDAGDFCIIDSVSDDSSDKRSVPESSVRTAVLD